MKLDILAQELVSAGWKRVAAARHEDWDFDVVGSRWFTLTKWHVLVKAIPVLDLEIAAEWKGNFEALSLMSKSWIWGKCFLLCLIAEQVSPEVTQQLSGDSFGLFGVFRGKGGGGNILIADEGNHAVYCRVPSLPYDVHKYSKRMKEILTRLMT